MGAVWAEPRRYLHQITVEEEKVGGGGGGGGRGEVGEEGRGMGGRGDGRMGYGGKPEHKYRVTGAVEGSFCLTTNQLPFPTLHHPPPPSSPPPSFMQPQHKYRLEHKYRPEHKYRVRAAVEGGFSFCSDLAPINALGGTAPTPMDYAAAAVAMCTATTVRLYADRKQWPLTHIAVTVEQTTPLPHGRLPDGLRLLLRLEGPLSTEQKERLLEIA
ncbi:unnamed protein product, partial [Closterium sp. Naga37s-1]